MQLPSIFPRLLPSDIPDAAERRIARGIMTVLGPGTLLLLILAALQPLMTEGGQVISIFYILIASPLLVAMHLVRRGNIVLAGKVAIALIWVVVTIMAVLSEGIRSPTVIAYPVLVGAAAYFWNARAAVGTAILSTLAALGMALASELSILPDPLRPVTDLRAWGGVAVATLLAGIVMKTTMDMIEEALSAAQESQRKFRDLIQGSPDGMLVVGRDCVIQEVNRKALSLLQAKREEILGEPAERLIPGISDLLDSIPGKPRRGTARSLPGREIPVNLSFNPVVSGEDRVHVVTLGDISDEIKAEEERRKVELRLREAQRMEAVGQLAGGIAHDFNNLLTVVLGNSSLELEREDLSEEERARWEEVDSAAAKAADLTHQLLAFSRQQIMAPEPVEPSSFLRDKGPLLQRILGERVRILMECRSKSWIRVDPSQMDNVLLALVQNARDAMAGRGTLRILCQEVSVRADDLEHPEVPEGTYVRLCFRDTGTGMDPDALKRAFEPFFTTKGFGDGLGLGLATVHGIVTQSGGYLTVSSTPGLGSTFCLYFPPIPPPDPASD